MTPVRVLILSFAFLSAVGIFTWSHLRSPAITTETYTAEELLSLPGDGDYDKNLAKLVDYQPEPTAPYFHAPCPVSGKIRKDIVSRFQLIGFENERNKRQWQHILETMNDKRDIESFKKNVRNFILVLLKIQTEGSHHLFGAAEGGDLAAYARVAICDEVAIAHHHIKDGIDPNIGQDYIDNPNLDISKQDRILFETLYRSCRMTISNAFRYTPCALTRVSFYPTEQDWSLILYALKIDKKRPNEIVCTYKSR